MRLGLRDVLLFFQFVFTVLGYVFLFCCILLEQIYCLFFIFFIYFFFQEDHGELVCLVDILLVFHLFFLTHLKVASLHVMIVLPVHKLQ